MGNSFSTTSTDTAPAAVFTAPGTFVTTAAAGLGLGYYANRQDVEDVFGRENVARWSQLDNDSTAADPRRIGAALAWADAQIDGTFGGGIYVVPLVINSGRATVTRWAAVLAGTWLYANRGQRDDGPPPNHYGKLLAEVRTEMAACRAGARALDAVRVGRLPSGPVVVIR